MDTPDTNRLETFSDGVIAVAITLLVLELHLPDLHTGGLFEQLAENWQQFLAYVMGFLMIGVYWANHHAVFRVIKRTDPRLVFANLMFLMVLVLVPFVTMVLSEQLGATGERDAVVLYSIAQFALAVSFACMWYTAGGKRRLIGSEVPDEVVSKLNRSVYPGIIGTGVVLAISWFAPLIALTITAIMLVVYAMPRHSWD